MATKKNTSNNTFIVSNDATFRLYYDEKTGTVKLVEQKKNGEVVFSATPITVSRRLKRDIKNHGGSFSDEDSLMKASLVGV